MMLKKYIKKYKMIKILKKIMINMNQKKLNKYIH